MGALDRNPYTPPPFLRVPGPGSINIVIYFEPKNFPLRSVYRKVMSEKIESYSTSIIQYTSYTVV